MFRGRYQLGEEVYLDTLCRDASGAPVAPKAAPWLLVFSASGLLVAKQLPRVDSVGAPALFGTRLFLTGVFAPGYYRSVTTYQIADYVGMHEDAFEVMAGGNPDGAIVSMYQYTRPQVTYLINSRDGGRIFPGLNPRF